MRGCPALYALFALATAALGVCSAAPSRYAYITIHYEGTAKDAEYVLGIRVMIRSIRMSGSMHDIIVLTGNSVSQQSRELFRAAGAMVLDVPDIPNPFESSRRLSYKKRFVHTLNKLYVWNMTQYERVAYLDADNIVLNKEAESLFKCGSLCVLFMNPCFFHTGLMIIKPDTAEFSRLLSLLGSAYSYDGADQGFLTNVYGADLLRAPLFLPSSTPYDGPQRLLPQDNYNHMWFYERGSFDTLRWGRYAQLEVPLLTLAYPILPLAKPWYWYPYVFFPMHWHWNRVRVSLEDGFLLDTLLRVALLPVAVLALNRALEGCARSRHAPGALRLLQRALDAHWAVALLLALLATLTLTAAPAIMVVPGLTPPWHAVPVAALWQHALLATLCGALSSTLQRPMRQWGFSHELRHYFRCVDRWTHTRLSRPPDLLLLCLAATLCMQLYSFAALNAIRDRLGVFFAVYPLHALMLMRRVQGAGAGSAGRRRANSRGSGPHGHHPHAHHHHHHHHHQSLHHGQRSRGHSHFEDGLSAVRDQRLSSDVGFDDLPVIHPA